MSKQEKTARSEGISLPHMETLEIGGALYSTQLTNKFKNRPQWVAPDQRKVLAVIPGTIQRIMVSAGSEVAAGESMLILEAMKMRNEIKAMHPGVIKKVNVKVGEQVPKFHLLVEFE